MATIGCIKDGSKFTWKNGVGVAEISDIGGGLLGHLFDDACDEGFCIKSPVTGKVEPFYLETTDLDGSGEDIYGWHFLPVNINLRLQGVRVLVIND